MELFDGFLHFNRVIQFDVLEVHQFHVEKAVMDHPPCWADVVFIISPVVSKEQVNVEVVWDVPQAVEGPPPPVANLAAWWLMLQFPFLQDLGVDKPSAVYSAMEAKNLGLGVVDNVLSDLVQSD